MLSEVTTPAEMTEAEVLCVHAVARPAEILCTVELQRDGSFIITVPENFSDTAVNIISCDNARASTSDQTAGSADSSVDFADVHDSALEGQPLQKAPAACRILDKKCA